MSNYETNDELGKSIGLTVGDTVILTTDYWDGVVGAKGDRGKVRRFALDAGVIFTFVRVASDAYGYPFPFMPSEIEKVEEQA
ncbi:hypothetical protein [Streptomyces sp. YPW6]|uniref:hypothetical protein n=1 Tax=Streptomyces sp. YPW6 TaxID=2840373 RepID=UPI003D7345DC